VKIPILRIANGYLTTSATLLSAFLRLASEFVTAVATGGIAGEDRVLALGTLWLSRHPHQVGDERDEWADACQKTENFKQTGKTPLSILQAAPCSGSRQTSEIASILGTLASSATETAAIATFQIGPDGAL
jgi:hypothetical protein